VYSIYKSDIPLLVSCNVTNNKQFGLAKKRNNKITSNTKGQLLFCSRSRQAINAQCTYL